MNTNIKEIQKRLIGLKEYMRKLRLQSAIYDMEEEQLQVEDDIMEYIHYTKSMIDCRKRITVYEDPIIYAIDQQEKELANRKKHQFECLCVLKAIYQLPTMYSELLLDYYVRDLHRFQIMQRCGIVESTFYRRHQKALEKLVELLGVVDEK